MAKVKSLKLKDDFKKIDKIILIFSILLFIFGLIMIFSASNVSLSMRGKNPFTYFYKQLIFLGISLIMFILVLKVSSKRYFFLSGVFGILLIGCLIYLLIWGDATRGAKSWIDFGFFSFQPSEFIKIILIVFMGCFYEKFREFTYRRWLYVLMPLIISALIFGFVVLQPDLGTGIIIFLVVVLTFLSIPIDRKKKYIILGVGIALIGIMAGLLFGLDLKSKFLSQTQLDRLNYYDPCSRYIEPTGYQLCNGYIAMNNGGLTGRGFGKSTQKYLYLPEPHNDFIMVIIVEELGMIAFIVIMIMYIVLLYRILRCAKNAYNLRGSVIAYGVAVYLFSHIVVNLGGVFGVFPMTGVPLPFLSYGGSSTLTLVLGLSLVQRVCIESYDYKRKMILKEGKNL